MNKHILNNYPMVNPTPIVLVGAEADGKANYTTVGAFGVACQAPIFYISLKHTHYTTKGVIETGYFSVNLPNEKILPRTDYCGRVSGHDADKSAIFESFYDEAGKAPMIMESPMNYLCKVIQQTCVRDFDVFFGEIIKTFVNENCLTDGNPDPLKIAPVLGMGATYYNLGQPIGDVFRISHKSKSKSQEE